MQAEAATGDEAKTVVVVAASATTCETCAWPHNKQTRARIECPYCAYVTCATCVKTDLLGSVTDPRCMGCLRGWSLEFLNTHMTKVFMRGEYRAQRERVLFDREQNLLPGSQVAAVVHKHRLDTHTALFRLDEEKQELRRRASQLESDRWNLVVRSRLAETMFAALATNPNAYTPEDVEQQLIQGIQPAGGAAAAANNRNAAASPFVRRCPANDCRGFLTSEWVCNLCRAHVCKTCHELLPDNEAAAAAAAAVVHVCDANNVATAALMARDTKPCPACGALITRISGCAHLFCMAPNCHTGFNWDTGAIIRGEVANPHYYEYMASQRAGGGGGGGARAGAEAAAAAVAGACRDNVLPVFADLAMLFPEHLVDPNLVQSVGRVYHCVRHFQRHVLAALGSHIPTPAFFLLLRSRFLLRHISEETFKAELQKAERLQHRYRAEIQVIEMFVATATDLVHQLVGQRHVLPINPPRSEETSLALASMLRDTLEQVERLRLYVNSSLIAVSDFHACTVVAIDASYHEQRQRFVAAQHAPKPPPKPKVVKVAKVAKRENDKDNTPPAAKRLKKSNAKAKEITGDDDDAAPK